MAQAEINLQRTEVRSTMNGYVTNVLREGDYPSGCRQRSILTRIVIGSTDISRKPSWRGYAWVTAPTLWLRFASMHPPYRMAHQLHRASPMGLLTIRYSMLASNRPNASGGSSLATVLQTRLMFVEIRDKSIRFQHEMRKRRRLSHELHGSNWANQSRLR